jgi:hypothetical protein
MTAAPQFAILGGFAGVLAAIGMRAVLRHRRCPDRRERERRLAVHQRGRLGDGMITDAGDDVLYYTYTLSGVVYSTSQDIRHLRAHLPADPVHLIGPVSLKYAPRNPANSIVLCEEWSGLRSSAPRTTPLKVLKCS